MLKPRNPTQQEVLDSIHNGIRKAQDDYKKAFMSHICSSYAPEYLMTVYIFRALLELKEKCGCTYGLSLEEPVLELARELGRTRGRYPIRMRVNGYCDLSLRDVDYEKPRVVIEVKKNAWGYWEDLERLACLVEKGLEFSVFASCWFEEVKDNNSKEAEDRIKREIRCIHEHIRKDIRRLGCNLHIKKKLGAVESLVLKGETPDQNKEWKWCPVCFVIYNKENQR